MNGQQWAPWQFFAVSDEECWLSYGIEPTKGKPKFDYDEQVRLKRGEGGAFKNLFSRLKFLGNCPPFLAEVASKGILLWA